MKILGREVRFSDSPQFEQRSLEQITDIGLAFEERIDELTGTDPTDIPEVARARQLTADTVASLPMQQLMGQTVTPDTPDILVQPDPQEIYHDTINGLVLDLVDHGNAFLWVKTRDTAGNPTSVYVLPQGEVTVNWDRNRLYRTYSWRDKNMEPFKEIVHISINRRRKDLRGKGLVDAAKDNMIATLRAQARMARSLAEDNYNPTTVIKHPSVKTKGDADRVRDMWMGDRDQRRGKNVPAVMGSEGELDQLTINPVDAEWIDSRHFEVQSVSRTFGIPGWVFLVDQGTSMTYSNTEGIMRFWATTTLRPSYLERIEQAFSMLLPSGRSARFNLDEILRADLEARYRSYAIGIKHKFLVPNEVREGEHLPALPGGDVFPEVEAEQASPAELNGASQ